ncbi:hypothetical protein [Archaeoglobus profundus]|uniref:Flagellin n=1 Tax=Archaeoglobus profundus (strain DSM 5631 / JCM 9629 / NBRC 100127 / Av18) TaxID=572546 RepID=D2RE93_ARCPA|nr:hypothetical protein [Archaeoglobus profundus]ADB58437.1 hypothetical protein Arcpr_1388 [Archaeoglobus profundus DSM 5631]
MTREVITNALLVIATVVAVSIFTTAMIPSIRDMSNTYYSMTSKLGERVGTDIRIIFIESTDTSLTFWVKNIGTSRIAVPLLNLSDVFIVSNSTSYHFTLSDSSVSYSIENGDGDNYWEEGETLRVNIDVSLPSGSYILNFVLYNGVGDSEVFSR